MIQDQVVDRAQNFIVEMESSLSSKREEAAFIAKEIKELERKILHTRNWVSAIRDSSDYGSSIHENSSKVRRKPLDPNIVIPEVIEYLSSRGEASITTIAEELQLNSCRKSLVKVLNASGLLKSRIGREQKASVSYPVSYWSLDNGSHT